MSASDFGGLIGSSGRLSVESMAVPVTVKDARSCFGRMDYLVTPTGGQGEKWVAADRVTLAKEGKQ